jgi:hypothetical protein
MRRCVKQHHGRCERLRQPAFKFRSAGVLVASAIIVTACGGDHPTSPSAVQVGRPDGLGSWVPRPSPSFVKSNRKDVTAERTELTNRMADREPSQILILGAADRYRSERAEQGSLAERLRHALELLRRPSVAQRGCVWVRVLFRHPGQVNIAQLRSVRNGVSYRKILTADESTGHR